MLRLLHLPGKQPVSGAAILQVSADQAPDGMPAMKAPAKPLPASQPGAYIFQIESGRPGNWALRLVDKVHGEPETLRARFRQDWSVTPAGREVAHLVDARWPRQPV